MALIRCENVSIGYEGQTVVKDLSFQIDAGDYLCIVGENGSGKSTLVKSLLGLKSVEKGQIVFGDGLRQNEIGYLPQQTAAQKDFPASVREVVLSGCLSRRGRRPFYSKTEKDIASANMEKLGITQLANQCYRELSGGQQQRVLIARALCATRELLILDEPITGLDPMAIQDFYSMIRKLNREDKVAIIMVSHDLRNAVEEANKILHLQKQVLFYGPAHDYMNSKAAGHFFHEKEQGECLPTAACHMAKNVDGLENNEQKCSCGHTHAHSPQKIEGGNTHERA